MSAFLLTHTTFVSGVQLMKLLTQRFSDAHKASRKVNDRLVCSSSFLVFLVVSHHLCHH